MNNTLNIVEESLSFSKIKKSFQSLMLTNGSAQSNRASTAVHLGTCITQSKIQISLNIMYYKSSFLPWMKGSSKDLWLGSVIPADRDLYILAAHSYICWR